MHVDDWDESFLSRFSPEEYVENLKIARIQNAMLYFQSHVGLCYYPTESGVMHRALKGRESMMKRTEMLCHESGIAVTGYYSLNYNTVEHDRHPEWRMLEENGRSRRENEEGREAAEEFAFASKSPVRYGFCCPNNPSYRAFVYRQIDEMLDYFDVEGMFFDMPFWPHTCHCSHCRARWASEVGGELPTGEMQEGSALHRTLMRKKYEWMGEWIGSVTARVKAHGEQISVEHNFANAIAGDSNRGCGEEVNEACDFVGGDLYGGILNHSLACKFYKNITKNAPFDYMFSRCKPALRSHTLTKSEDEMLTEILLTTAHHGATMVIDAIDPVGTLDRRVYERIGRVFEREAAYEPYLHGKMVEDVGLYYGIRSRFGSSYCGFDSKDGCIGASRALIASHVPFGVTGGFYTLSDYSVIAAPMLSEQERLGELLRYVAEGGKLYFSGAGCQSLLAALTGGRLAGYTEHKQVYLAPTSENEALFGGFNAAYPLPFDTRAPLLENVKNGETVAYLTLPYTKPGERRFASIHSDPPGIATAYPAVLEGRYGKGSFIWSALPVEAIGIEEYQNILIGFLKRLRGEAPFSFVSNAPAEVEITLFEDADCYYVNVVHLAERTTMPTLPPFEIGIRTDAASDAELLPNGASIELSRRDGYVYLRTRPLHVFDLYRIRK